jgi:type II secretory pathway component PulC
MLTKRQVTLINLVLALILAGGGGYMFWTYYQVGPSEEVTALPAGPPVVLTTPTPLGPDYYGLIVSRNLWREKFAAPVEGPPPTPVPPPVPPPNLNLLGTSIREDPKRSSAIIEEVAKKQQHYSRIGDVVAGATVLEIHRNQVVLDHRGNIFTISTQLHKDRIPVERRSLPLSRVIRPLGKNQWLISKQGLWQLISNNKWLVSQKGLWQLLDVDRVKVEVKEVQAEIMKALANVGCRTYYPPGRPRRGEAEGYEILVLPPRHLAIFLGIKKGDIIRTVNEEVITSKNRALELLQEVQDEEVVIVEIEREKETIQLEYRIQYELLEL